ncbi:MAG: o-succinylbenzoate--CoA ligase [Myxococcota bacterium]
MNSNLEEGWIAGLSERAEQEALFVDGQTFTYSEMASVAMETADQLRTIGIAEGDLVVVLASPSVGGVILIHALIDQQIAMLPLNARLTEAEQIAALVRARPRFLIVGPEFDNSKARRLAKAAQCGLIALSSSAEDPRSQTASLTVSLSKIVNVSGREPFPESRIEAGVAFILLTSGTTGQPKQAMLTLANLIASARASNRLLGRNAKDRWLLCLPLFHIGGLSILLRSALARTSVALHTGFDANRVVAAFEADRITCVSFVATMLAEVIEARGETPPPASLRLILLGGGPAPATLLDRAESLGYPIAPTYGLTEAASQVATRPPTEPAAPRPDDLAGGLVPLAGVEIRIMDANGKLMAEGGAGEIQLRGPIVMKGYRGERAARNNAIQAGWLSTGDIGRLDERGHLRVLDRRTDLIISGGENIYPAEIESVLAEYPDIEEAGVVGCPDSKFGARPLAFVVLRPGRSLDQAALVSFCRERLAGFKVPVDFIEMASLPKTASGKLRRQALIISS